jgi:hypothetical protein
VIYLCRTGSAEKRATKKLTFYENRGIQLNTGAFADAERFQLETKEYPHKWIDLEVS